MKKEMNNKGFSLVELIIVIAIMAVLVGILAPQYLKYVNNSKVSTDITNANELATVTNTLIAESKLTGTTVTIAPADAVPATLPASPTDKDYILMSLGRSVSPKYDTSATYTITFDIATGVSEVTYTVGTDSYEAYPNPDNATDGMNAKLKK